MTKSEQLDLVKKVAELETRIVILEKKLQEDKNQNGVEELKVRDVMGLVQNWIGKK